MAKAARIYEVLWSPEKIGIISASQMILPLEKGIKELEANPDKYKANPIKKKRELFGKRQLACNRLMA